MRILLFVLMQNEVLVTVSIVGTILMAVFGIRLGGGGYTGLLVMCAIFGCVGSIISLFMSKFMVKKAYGVRVITAPQNQREYFLVTTIADMARRYGFKVPEVGIYDSQEMNAFATGASKDDSLVAVSSALLYSMNEEELKGVLGHEMSHIANGDMARVRKVRHHRCIYGFDFADAVLEFPDYDSLEIEATLVLNTLTSEAASLTRAESEHLFQSVWEDYPEVTNKRERLKKIKTDALYNALQVKFAYAVTCHKAQGGQWERVFIDQGYVGEDQSVDEFARWLYTAVTRARKCVYLVNWPSSQLL